MNVPNHDGPLRFGGAVTSWSHHIDMVWTVVFGQLGSWFPYGDARIVKFILVIVVVGFSRATPNAHAWVDVMGEPLLGTASDTPPLFGKLPLDIVYIGIGTGGGEVIRTGGGGGE